MAGYHVDRLFLENESLDDIEKKKGRMVRGTVRTGIYCTVALATRLAIFESDSLDELAMEGIRVFSKGVGGYVLTGLGWGIINIIESDDDDDGGDDEPPEDPPEGPKKEEMPPRMKERMGIDSTVHLN